MRSVSGFLSRYTVRSSDRPVSGVRSLILLSGRYSVRRPESPETKPRSETPQLVRERVVRPLREAISSRSCSDSTFPLRSKLSVAGSTAFPATRTVSGSGAAVAAGTGEAVASGSSGSEWERSTSTATRASSARSASPAAATI